MCRIWRPSRNSIFCDQSYFCRLSVYDWFVLSESMCMLYEISWAIAMCILPFFSLELTLFVYYTYARLRARTSTYTHMSCIRGSDTLRRMSFAYQRPVRRRWCRLPATRCRKCRHLPSISPPGSDPTSRSLSCRPLRTGSRPASWRSVCKDALINDTIGERARWGPIGDECHALLNSWCV